MLMTFKGNFRGVSKGNFFFHHGDEPISLHSLSSAVLGATLPPGVHIIFKKWNDQTSRWEVSVRMEGSEFPEGLVTGEIFDLV